MNQQWAGDISYLCFEKFQRHDEVRHFVSTRQGGCSEGKFGSLNLSIKLDPHPDSAIENRKRLLDALELPFESLTLGNQTHSSNVTVVQRTMSGAGARTVQTALPETDALVTALPGITISVLVADCVPILLFDPVRRAIGAVHAGRMGTIAEIAMRTVEKMATVFSSDPADIIAGIGPSICATHYQVSAEAQQEICTSSSADYLLHANGASYFDLWGANIAHLLSSGVARNNIDVAGLCTFENSTMFFSERRDKKPTGRFCAGICMVD